MILNRDILFIHIPKTGGVSCCEVLCRHLPGPVYYYDLKSLMHKTHFNAQLLPGIGHETLEEVYRDAGRIRAQTGIDVRGVQKVVAVIRHPVDLELSTYYFYREGIKQWRHLPMFQEEHVTERMELARGDLKTFVERSGYFRQPTDERADYTIESYFTIDGEIPDGVWLLKFEQLEQQFRETVGPFLDGGDYEFPRRNVSADHRPDEPPELDAATLQAIYDKHRWLFERGYYDIKNRPS